MINAPGTEELLNHVKYMLNLPEDINISIFKMVETAGPELMFSIGFKHTVPPFSDEYENASKLLERVKTLFIENDIYKESVNKVTNELKDAEAEIERLKKFEDYFNMQQAMTHNKEVE